MNEIIKKIEAWFKAIDWKKVGCTVLGLLGVGLVLAVLERANDKITIESLEDPDYGIKLWLEACKEFADDGCIERFNDEWFKNHPDFDPNNEDHIQAQTDAIDEMLKPYLDKVAKENSIDGKMLVFDEHEPVLFKSVNGYRDCYTPIIHAKIEDVD